MGSNPCVLLHGPQNSSISESYLTNPRLSDYPPDYVLLEIAYTGVCGSDVHFYLHGGVGSDQKKYAQYYVSQSENRATHTASTSQDTLEGLVMGHEASATVLETGASVPASTLVPGDNVAIEPGIPCRSCARCSEGLYNLCFDMRFAASFYEETDNTDVVADSSASKSESTSVVRQTPGTLSKYYVLPATLCYRLPNHISLQEGVLVEPLAVAVHAVRLARISPQTKSVLITGAGTIGLCVAAVSAAYGVAQLSLVDISEQKLSFAKQWLSSESGAATRAGVAVDTHLSQPCISSADLANGIKARCSSSRGVDAAVECTGSSHCTGLAISTVRAGGHIVQTGLSKSPVIDGFPITDLSEKEIHFHGAFRYGQGDFSTARDLLARGQVGNVKGLICKVWNFEDYEEAWKATKNGSSYGGTKNLIRGP